MVEGSLQTKSSASLKIGSHQLIAGLSASEGGQNEGPTPHELVEAGLAACTILTCQLYARRKQWPLEGIDVKVEITKEERGQAHFVVRVHFAGPLSDEQRDRLRDISARCPIHRLLESEITLETVMT